MRIVVTGATGNVGSRLLPQLLALPQAPTVVGLARRPPASAHPRLEYHAVDVAVDDVGPLLRGADIVVHLAWLLQPAHDPDAMRRVNVTGTGRLVDAVVAEGVPALVHASSLGAYSPGPKVPVDEDHPTEGISTSTYSRQKAEVERLLDRLEADHPERRVVRLRPGVVLQADAASELARYFLGPFVPQSLVWRALVPRALAGRALLPVVPAVPGLAVQVVHAEDMARAYALACATPVTGAFNIAAEPALDPPTLSRLLGAREVPVSRTLLRALVDLTWRLHLQPTDPGWVDLALRTPLLDTTRARTVLGWTPRVSAQDAVLEVLAAMGSGRGAPSPVLRPRATGSARLLEAVRAMVPGGGRTG